ncbi:hypothetical protein BJ988_003063 [Nocardioides panzhihuensis]|uniref:Uncharacterized protein n=1 Tax=Nocardioides panzhihuensis TaxID=860243 RepID=A0A7Z0DMK0_9ACTN|nr:hypothetical protein [Nocardioides panzhihuensis]NYI78415.1 hypothetical protein [Nocardioides panzhihuensis]
MEPVDRGIGRHAGCRTPVGLDLQGLDDLGLEAEQLAGRLRLGGAHGVLAEQGGGRPHGRTADVLGDLGPGDPGT